MPSPMRASLTCSNRLGCTMASSFVILSSHHLKDFICRRQRLVCLPRNRLQAISTSTGNVRDRLGGCQAGFGMSHWEFLGHTARSAQCGNDIFGVSRNAVLVEIHAVEFCVFRQAQHSSCIYGDHDGHGDAERSQSDDCAADDLCDQNLSSPTVEQSLDRKSTRLNSS